MPYVPFHKHFPDIAEKETRALIVVDDEELPAADYCLTEMYCDEPGCDCRRVFFNIFSSKTEKSMAIVAFGWETTEYYQRWLGEDDPNMINELKGPALNSASYQSKLAPALLEKIRHVLQDKKYVERIKKHYKMFRDYIEEEKKDYNKKSIMPQVNRNDPCPCGSGKKYKKCCIGK